MQPNSEEPDELLWNYIEALKCPDECRETERPDTANAPALASFFALADALHTVAQGDMPDDEGKRRAELRLRQLIDAGKPAPPVTPPSSSADTVAQTASVEFNESMGAAPAARQDGKARRRNALFPKLLVALLIAGAICYAVWHRVATAQRAAAIGSQLQHGLANRKVGSHC